jgi:integrase
LSPFSAPTGRAWPERRARHDARAYREADELKLDLPTFEECVEIYIRERWLTWSKKHRDQWPSSLKRYAYATIGKLTIPEIKPSRIYELLRPIWVEKRETANRVRGRIETIIAKNINVDDTDFRNPAELTKQLREKLPRRPKRVVRHHPALPYAEASHFMANLSAAGGIAASMLRFLILTACRTNEVVEARWSEIDRPSSTWKIPSERMKMHQDHVVPLSEPALAILDKMRDGSQGDLTFPNPDDEMFSENAMLAVLDRLGYSPARNVTESGDEGDPNLAQKAIYEQVRSRAAAASASAFRRVSWPRELDRAIDKILKDAMHGA